MHHIATPAWFFQGIEYESLFRTSRLLSPEAAYS